MNATGTRQLRATFTRYGAFLRWFAADSLLRNRWRAVAILVAGFLAILIELNAIAMVIYYGHLLEDDGALTILGRELAARTSGLLLVLLASAVLTALLLSALLNYYSGTRTLRLRRTYEIFCSRRAIRELGRRTWMPTQDPRVVTADSIVTRIIRRDARYCGRVMVSMLTAVVPAITCVVAVVGLVITNILLTLGLMVLVGVSSVFYYRVSVRGARNSAQMEIEMDQASGEYQQVIRRARGCAAPYPEDGQWLEAGLFEGGHVRNFFRAYEARLRVTDASQLISNIVFAIAIFGLIVVLGYSSILGGEGWGRLVIFLVALRYALANLKQIHNKFTSINRFYPQVRRYFEFVRTMETAPDAAADDRLPDACRIRPPAAAPGGLIPESLDRYEVRRGAPIAVLSPVDLTRYSMPWLMHNLLAPPRAGAEAALRRSWFATIDHGWLANRSVIDCLGFPEDYSAATLAVDLGSAPLAEEAMDALGASLTEPMSVEQWRNIAPAAKFLLAVARGVRAEGDWFLLDQRGLQAVEEEAPALLNRLADRFVGIVYGKRIDGAGRFGEDTVAVLTEDGLRGVGPLDWYRRRLEAGDPAFRGIGPAPGAAAADDEEDDEEL